MHPKESIILILVVPPSFSSFFVLPEVHLQLGLLLILQLGAFICPVALFPTMEAVGLATLVCPVLLRIVQDLDGRGCSGSPSASSTTASTSSGPPRVHPFG